VDQSSPNFFRRTWEGTW